MENSKNENKTNNRIAYLYFLVFLTSILLTTTSYAWFTTSRVVTISSLNIHVATEGGIEISVDGKNWKSVIDLTDLQDARDTYPSSKNQIPNYISPVSTGGNISNGSLMLYQGVASNEIGDGENFILVTERATEEEGFAENSEGHFIAFDFFLKTTSEHQLYLSTNAGVKYDGEEATGIENAFRVAYLNEGTVPTDAELSTIQHLNKANSVFIWEPNSDVHTESGVKNALNVYNIETSLTNGSPIPYDGVIDEIFETDNVTIEDAKASKYPKFFKKVNVDLASRKNFTTNQKIFEVKGGITKYRVYVWIEGQDVDCENDASRGDVIVNLQITTNP